MEGGSHPSLRVRLLNLAGLRRIRPLRFFRWDLLDFIAWEMFQPRCWSSQAATTLASSWFLSMTAIPVLRVPGLMLRVRSGTRCSPSLRPVSRTANRPCFQHLTAFLDSSHLRALEGLVGAAGMPSGSSTGTDIWLCFEMCLVIDFSFWAASPDGMVRRLGTVRRRTAASPMPSRDSSPCPGPRPWGGSLLGFESCGLAERPQVILFARVGRSRSCLRPLSPARLCNARNWFQIPLGGSSAIFVQSISMPVSGPCRGD